MIAGDFIEASHRWTLTWWAKWASALVLTAIVLSMFIATHVVLTAGDEYAVDLRMRSNVPASEQPGDDPVPDQPKWYPVGHCESWDGGFASYYTRLTLFVPLWMLCIAAAIFTGMVFRKDRIAVRGGRDGVLVIRRYWHVRWWGKWASLLASVIFLGLWTRASHLDICYGNSGYGIGYSDWRHAGECVDAYKWYPSRAIWAGMEPGEVGAWAILVPFWMLVATFCPLTLLLFRSDRRHFPVGRCRCCGYCLAGNVSGVCPECGLPVPGQGAPVPPSSTTK